MKKLKILVTGGTGFIGSHLISSLLPNNDIIVLKRSTSQLSRLQNVLGRVQTYDVDNSDIKDIFMKTKPDVVVHLATHYKKAIEYSEIEPMLDTNILFPTKVLEAMIASKSRIFVNTGTFFQYLPQNYALDENARLFAFNHYAATKTAFEKIVEYYTDNKFLVAATLRLFSPYGPRDNENKIIPLLINKISNQQSLDMSPGEQRLDFTYVEDIVQAYLKAIDFLSKESEGHHVFNIGAGQARSLREVADIIAKILNKKHNILFGVKKYSENEIMYSEANNRKAKELLNWLPTFNLEKGIADIIGE